MRMHIFPRVASLTACLLALAACQGDRKAEQQDTAAGEILPGSASDAMLPYDTVRSQPPLAPPPTATATGRAGGKASGADGEAETAGESAAPEPAPTTPAQEPPAP